MYKKGAGIIIFILFFLFSLPCWGLINISGDPFNPDPISPSVLDNDDGDGGGDLSFPSLNPDGTTQDTTGDSSGTRGLPGGPAPQGIPDVALPSDPVQNFVDNLGDILGRTLQPADPIGDIAQYVDPGEDLIENTADDRIHQIMVDTNTGILTDSIYRKIESPGVGWELQLEESRQYRFIPEEVMEEAESNIPEEQISQAEEEGLLVGNWLATSVEEESPDFYGSLATVYAAAQTGPEESSGDLTEADLPAFMSEVVGIEGKQVGDSYYALKDEKLYRAYLDNGRIVLDVFETDKAGDIYDNLTKNYSQVSATKKTYVFDRANAGTPAYVTIDGKNYFKSTNYTLVASRDWEPGFRIGVKDGSFVDEYKGIKQPDRYSTPYTDYQFAEDQNGNLLGFARKNEKENKYELIEADGETVKLTVSGDNYRRMLDGIKTPLKESGLISEKTDQAVLSYLLSDRAEISEDTINCKDLNDALKAVLHLGPQGELKLYSYKTATHVGFWQEGLSAPVTFEWDDLKSGVEKIANELPDLNSLNLSTLRYNFGQNRLIYQNGDTYYYVDYDTNNETINHYGKIVGNSLTAYNASGEVIGNIENKDISGILSSENLSSIDDFLDKFDIDGTTITIDGSAVEEHSVSDSDVRDFAQKVLGLDESKYTGETVDIEGAPYFYFIYENNNNFYAVNVSGNNATVYQYTADNGLQKLSYGKSGNWQQNQQPATTETLLSKEGVEKVKGIVGKTTVDAALFKDLIGGSENINNNHNFKLTVTEASNNEGTLIVGADENGKFVGAVKQIGDNYTVYTTDGEYSFTKSDLDLGTIEQVLINGENDFTIKGSNGAFRVYNDSGWKAIAAVGDGADKELRFWDQLTGDPVVVKGEGAATIWDSGDARDIIKKLSYNSQTNIVLKQEENTGWGKYKVFKLGKDPDKVESGTKLGPNEYNIATSVCELDATRGNKAVLNLPGGIKVIISEADIQSLLGVSEITAETIKNLASRIYGLKKNREEVPQQLVLRNNNNDGYLITGLTANQDGSYSGDLEHKMEVTDSAWRNIKSALGQSIDLDNGLSLGSVDEADSLDVLDDRVIFDLENGRIKIGAKTLQDGTQVYDEEYQCRVFNPDGSEVTAQLTQEERLTPLGEAYEEAVKVLEIFGYTVDWEILKKGVGSRIEVESTAGGRNAYIRLGDDYRIQSLIYGENQGQEVGLSFEWQEDGTAKLSGLYVDTYLNTLMQDARGTLNLNTGKVELEGSGIKLQMSVNETSDTKEIKRNYEFSQARSLAGVGLWPVTKYMATETYRKEGEDWKLSGLVEEFSDGSHTIEITYNIENDGTCKQRVIKEGETEATETIVGNGDWLDYREKLMHNQDPGELEIEIQGSRINPQTGKPEDISGTYIRSREEAKDKEGNTVKDSNGNPVYQMVDTLQDESTVKDIEFYKEAVRVALSKVGLTPENDTELEEIAKALMKQGLDQAIQVVTQRLVEGLTKKYGEAKVAQQLTQQILGGKHGEYLQKLFKYIKDTKIQRFYDPVTSKYISDVGPDDILNVLAKAQALELNLPEPGQQRPGARAGGGAAPGGGRQGQPGQGGGQMPPGGWTPYGGQDIPQIAQDKLFNPDKGIFGTDDPVERINRIHNRYPEVINQWAQAMGMSPEEWMNKFRNLTRDDARKRWLKEQNIKATAQKLRTAYLKGLGLGDEQISKVMSMLGDKEACINYLMQALGISQEEAEAIYNMLMSLGTEDGIRKYLEKLGYSEEEINAFIEKLNEMKEEKKQYLKELGLSDEEIEEVLGMSKEEAEAKLKELGLSDEQIKEYFAKEEGIRQYLKEEMGIEDEDEIDKILALDEEQARAYLENRSLDIDIDEFLALETDEEKLEYLKNYFINEKGMSEEEATQRAQEIMDKLSKIGDAHSNQPDVEALQKYFNEHDININLDEFLALGSEEEMLNYLKDYFLNNEGLSEEEAQARVEEVMDNISDMLGGAQGIEDKILEMYDYLEENNYNTEEFLKEIGFDNDKLLEFKRLTEGHARYWFLTDTFENLIAQKNPDMSEEEVKEKAEWLAGLILGKEVKEDMRLVPVSARERLREILSAWEDAAKELGLDKAGINDRFREAAGQVQPGVNPQQPGQPGQTPQQPGAVQRVAESDAQNQIVFQPRQQTQPGQQVQPGQQGQPQGNTRAVQPQPNANRPSDEEIEQMLEGIGDDLVVSLLTGEMFPENAREVALNIMREHMQDFNWNGNGEGGDNDNNRPPIGINPPVQPVPMSENWTQNRAPWEVEGVDMNNWFERYRNQFQTPQEFTAWTQAWKDWYENLLQRASALHTHNVQKILRRGSLVTRPGRGF